MTTLCVLAGFVLVVGATVGLITVMAAAFDPDEPGYDVEPGYREDCQ